MKILSIVCVLTLLVLSSCQKELDIDPNDPPPPGSTNDSIYLSKFVVLDTTLPPGQDTLWTIGFFYDNNKRLSRLTEFENDPPAFDGVEDNFFYTGNDTLPYMAVEYQTMNNFPYLKDTNLYTYTNGVVSRDTTTTRYTNTGELFDESGFRYVISGNSLIIQGSFTTYGLGIPTVTHYSGTANPVYSGGNIIQQTATPGVTAEDYVQTSYDNKINPFYRFDIHYPVFGSLNALSFQTQKNNVVSQNLGDSPASLYNKYRFSYVYREDGYPLISRAVDLNDPGYHVKELYFYTR